MVEGHKDRIRAKDQEQNHIQSAHLAMDGDSRHGDHQPLPGGNKLPHLHGRNFLGKVMEFCELVYAKPLRKRARKRSLRSRAVQGIWLGIEPQTGELRVALLGGGPVVRVRTVIRVPDSAKGNTK